MAPPESPATAPKVCYKYVWAEFVAQWKLENDYKASKAGYSKLAHNRELKPEAATISGLAETLKPVTGGGVIPEKPGYFNVGIIGAGVAGLFTALAIDWINDTIAKEKGSDHLHITYEILEASKEVGGRLYTHHFNKDVLHDYYDVGAMRFPRNAIMDRTFSLFEMLGIKEGKLGDRTHVNDPPRLIKYYLRDDKNKCPTLFNNVRKVGNPYPKDSTETDPFALNVGIAPDKQIPENLLKTSPGDLFEKAIGGFIKYIKKYLDEYIDKKKPMSRAAEEKLWKILMKCDKMSVRQFLRTNGPILDLAEDGEKIPHGANMSYNTIQWLETATYGTGWYDQSLTEAVLESIDFYITDDETKIKETNDHWFCIDGGAQKIAEEMRKKMKNQSAIRFNTQVVGMNANLQINEQVTTSMTVMLKDSISRNSLPSRDYFTVFSSATLGSMNRMDLSKAGLLWDTKQAIRCLGYGASCKVGIKFKTPWWQEAPYDIDQGGLARTDLAPQVCVYPSYNINKEVDPRDKPAVLLVSYTWGQTAQRLASLIASKPRGELDAATNERILKEEAELKEVMLRDLAFLHTDDHNDTKKLAATLKMLNEQYVEHHAYDWYHDPQMAGAFAYFGPSQFSELYPAITKPNAGGQLYFVGEAASAHHAWVVGALESVVRALYLMFDALHQGSRNDPKMKDTYEAYKWAMDLLEFGYIKEHPAEGEKSAAPTATPTPTPLPFFPLPAEMPRYRRNFKNMNFEEPDNSGDRGGFKVAESAAAPQTPHDLLVSESARADAFSQAPAGKSVEVASSPTRQEFSDHPAVIGTGEVKLTYGAALVALSTVESAILTLAELTGEELKDQLQKISHETAST
ncbi:flavin containing amine oxidoreductase [Colletotrichum paranaense]|uniref:Flavin containing amine oxidoreductase n=1 Tax=Colletotrichum paranaense TaxID=1914294 RepID=A0ABQ9SGU1_9PEZI|nr:flavin containing amine oxidoreductase [Colletotrichum paranaense]KAK1535929.1 flavin containing amine oxidoreductase [Colletotrichum paranaense]